MATLKEKSSDVREIQAESLEDTDIRVTADTVLNYFRDTGHTQLADSILGEPCTLLRVVGHPWFEGIVLIGYEGFELGDTDTSDQYRIKIGFRTDEAADGNAAITDRLLVVQGLPPQLNRHDGQLTLLSPSGTVAAGITTYPDKSGMLGSVLTPADAVSTLIQPQSGNCLNTDLLEARNVLLVDIAPRLKKQLNEAGVTYPSLFALIPELAGGLPAAVTA